MPEAPTYADPDQLAAFSAWLNSEISRRGISKSRLAAVLGYDSIQHVNKILRGTLPMPPTLYRICCEAGISWLAAFANAGYYHEILHALAALAHLSDEWLREDEAYPSPDDHSQFRFSGVLRIHGQIASDVPNLAERYHVGSYCVDHSDVEIGDLSDVPEEHRADFERRLRAPEIVRMILPKPLGAAILIAIAGFPRRGDVWKNGTSDYAARLLEAITPQIGFTYGSPRRRPLPLALQAADDALKNRIVPLDARRVIASEYIVSWADSLCQTYTHYARLASLEYFGVAGSSLASLSVEVRLPQIRKATLPDVEEFSQPVLSQ